MANSANHPRQAQVVPCRNPAIQLLSLHLYLVCPFELQTDIPSMGYPSLKPFRHRCQYCWCFPQLQSFQFLCKCIPKTNMSLGMPVTLPSLISTGPVCISYSMMGNRGCDKDPCRRPTESSTKSSRNFASIMHRERV